MAHSFIAKANRDLPALFGAVKDKIVAKGGSFVGDTSRGKFVGNTPAGKVAVEYAVLADGAIKFTITDKPFIVPNSTIESTIREYLA